VQPDSPSSIARGYVADPSIYLATLIFVAGALLALRGIRAAQKT